MTTRVTGTLHGGSPTLADIRKRFGGIDVLASIVGTLTAVGVMVFLVALQAMGDQPVPLQMNLIDAEGTLLDIDGGGFAVALGVVLVAFLIGGWATGRMARFDGGLNGLITAFWMLVLIAGFAALGTGVGEEWNAFAIAGLPDWASQVSTADATVAAVTTAVGAVVVMFLAAWIGGRLGETYHHPVDAAIVHAALHPDTEAETALPPAIDVEPDTEIAEDVVEVEEDVEVEEVDSTRGDTAIV